MRAHLIAACWPAALAAATLVLGQDRAEQEVNDAATAKKLALEAFEEVFEVQDDALIAVTEENGGYGRFRVHLDRMPDGCFGTPRQPTAWVKKNGDVVLWVWRLDATGKDLPHPSAIAQSLTCAKKKDPDTAITLIRRWLDANRDRDDYAASMDSASPAGSAEPTSTMKQLDANIKVVRLSIVMSLPVCRSNGSPRNCTVTTDDSQYVFSSRFMAFLDLFSWAGEGKLFRNQEGKGFENVGEASPKLPTTVSLGATWGDFDGDGFVDLYVGGYEAWPSKEYPDVMLLNEKGERFVEHWRQDRIRAREITAADFDEDGDLDVYVSNYRLQPNSVQLRLGCFPSFVKKSRKI